jgi:Fe-S cluster assembly iron-binding protein IscA
MLQCTPAAVTTLQAVRQHNDIPEDHGVRLFPAPAPEGEYGLGIDFAAEPQADDVVSEQHGTTIMVDAGISEQLDGLTLDAVPDPTQDGSGAPQLVLRAPEG